MRALTIHGAACCMRICDSAWLQCCSAAALGALAAVDNVKSLFWFSAKTFVRHITCVKQKISLEQGIIISGGLLSHLLIIIVTFFSPYSPALRCGLYSVQCTALYSGGRCSGGDTGSCPVSSGLTVRHGGHGAVTQIHRDIVTRHTSHVTRHTSGG